MSAAGYSDTSTTTITYPAGFSGIGIAFEMRPGIFGDTEPSQLDGTWKQNIYVVTANSNIQWTSQRICIVKWNGVSCQGVAQVLYAINSHTFSVPGLYSTSGIGSVLNSWKSGDYRIMWLSWIVNTDSRSSQLLGIKRNQTLEYPRALDDPDKRGYLGTHGRTINAKRVFAG